MFSFIRKIRRSLIENPTRIRQYFLYSIGEILLVVIGILIALQINNWNENSKARTLEKSTLIEINNSLQSDIRNFEEQIKTQRGLAEVTKQLLDHIEDKKEYTPKLDRMWEAAIRFYMFRFNNSAFNLLESRGIDLIRNEALRNQIVTHYNFEQSFIQKQSDIAQKLDEQKIAYFFDRLYNQITDDFGENFNYKKEILIPLDYQALLNDPIIVAKLSYSIKARYRLSQLIKEYIEKERDLSLAIEKELDKMN